MLLYWTSIIPAVIAAIGCVYLAVATALTARFPRRSQPATPAVMPRVTILKPLHGVEPGLFENLASFCTQNYAGAVQIVFGVQDPRDEAIAVVEELRAKFADRQLDLVVDTTMHGLNRKVSNLINMWRRAEHDVIVLADADMRVDSDYLARVVTALEQPGVGAVTCLYHGLPGAGFWARLSALGINAHFLPNVIMGLGLNMAQPCFGSTIALSRKALVEIGGFVRVADCLADDYALGTALRARGYDIAVSPLSIGHMCGDVSAADLWHHELRWARTIRSLDPAGYAGSIVTHAFAVALVAALAGVATGAIGLTLALGLCTASFGCRLALVRQVERAFNVSPQSSLLVALREVLSFAVFVSSLFGQSAKWKGHHYRFVAGGTLVHAGNSSRSRMLWSGGISPPSAVRQNET
jgi:ceramide glucosyltransferase